MFKKWLSSFIFGKSIACQCGGKIVEHKTWGDQEAFVCLSCGHEVTEKEFKLWAR